jgi:SapC
MSTHQILNPTDHAELRVHSGVSSDFGDNVMACLTTPSEFRSVQAHYPIVFSRDISTGAFSALAMFGFENGENLFLVGDRWDARYRPMAQTIQPFLIGRAASDEAVAQVHIDMNSPRISKNGQGVRVFDMDGRPTPFLEAMATRLADLDQGYRQSPDFCAALERLDLLEPFTLEVPLDDGSRHSLVGYQIIAEERLAALGGTALGDLQAKGYLLPIFMAVASLSRFSDLVARKNARLTLG